MLCPCKLASPVASLSGTLASHKCTIKQVWDQQGCLRSNLHIASVHLIIIIIIITMIIIVIVIVVVVTTLSSS
jgi:hypothetical protein